MKRVMMLLGALLCFFSACTQMENEMESMNVGKTVRLSLSMPETCMTPITRAGGDVALRFIAEVWSYDEAAQKYATLALRKEQKVEGGNKSATLSFDLETQGKYRLLLWADYVDATATADENGAFADKYYDTKFTNTTANEYKGLKGVKVITDNFALNTEARDAFYKSVDFEKGETNLTLEAQTLTRAVGKLVVKEKLAEAYSKSTTFSVSYDVPNTFSVETGVTVGKTPFKVNVTEQAVAGNAETEDYTLFYDYVLVSAGEAGYTIATVTLTGEGGYVKEGIPALPIKQNKRTVVSGSNMLVAPAQPGNTVDVTATIDDVWSDDITMDGDGTGETPTEPDPIDPTEAAFVGSGTSDAPFELGTADDLAKLMELVNAGTAIPGEARSTAATYAEACYKQTAEIFASGVCIGTATNPFKGVYDGNGMKISGYSATDGTTENGLVVAAATADMGDVALFGVVENATLKNIRLVVNNQNKTDDNTSAAGICAVAKGTVVIENSLCDIANLTCNGVAIAGICAVAETGSTLTIVGCKVKQFKSSGIKGNASQNEYIGGILGQVKSGATATITDSYNTAKIVQTPDEADKMGGICGGNEGALTLMNCYSNASFGYQTDITDFANSAALSGYLVGGEETVSGVTITDCYYVKPNGKKAQAKIDNGATMMKEGSWPVWDINSTKWGSVGAFDATAPVYPTLDWE
ncbi:Uncharacterised protein [Bacteroides uniformis]|uniref:DUF6562 domain-containing protein n=1 Tax=Bacteroides uniformis TaxID=820 RepID=A0A174RZ47_BACUN|nr:DUF6562 domain-containing protein [Bacteroides uniformis]CUP90944.1 Uncharacterised protein [Bacteroides uniformis]